MSIVYSTGADMSDLPALKAAIVVMGGELAPPDETEWVVAEGRMSRAGTINMGQPSIVVHEIDVFYQHYSVDCTFEVVIYYRYLHLVEKVGKDVDGYAKFRSNQLTEIVNCITTIQSGDVSPLSLA